nr:NADH-plastoquinone oxidoreductase subunit J [Solanum imamense]UNZ92740.1 NADH-plastoquinone oxidoreductase subunit J [Solanum imamense]
MQGRLSAWLVKHGLIHRSFTNKARGLAFHCCHFLCIWVQLSTLSMCL